MFSGYFYIVYYFEIPIKHTMLVQFFECTNHFTDICTCLLFSKAIVLQMVEHLTSRTILHKEAQMFSCSECSIQRHNEWRLVQNLGKDLLLSEDLLKTPAISDILFVNHFECKQSTRHQVPYQINFRGASLANATLKHKVTKCEHWFGGRLSIHCNQSLLFEFLY